MEVKMCGKLQSTKLAISTMSYFEQEYFNVLARHDIPDTPLNQHLWWLSVYRNSESWELPTPIFGRAKKLVMQALEKKVHDSKIFMRYMTNTGS